MAEIASAYVSLLPSAKGFGKKLDGQVGGETQGAAKRLGAGFGKTFALAGGALAAVGIGSFLKDAVGGAGDLEQSIGAIDTVFGKSAKKMHEWSSAAAQDVGLTRNEFNELGTLIGAQLKNGGVAMDELAPKANNLIGLGADLSSMFGGTTKEAVEALSSALKGERDPIERYGVSLNQAKIDAEAAALGFEKVDGALSDEAKQAATLSLIMKQTNDAHGNFAKESGTYAGKVQRLGAQWGDFKTTIGTAVLPILTDLVGFLNDRAMPAISTFADNVGPAFSNFKDAVGGIRDKLDFGPKLREIAETSWGKLKSGIQALKDLRDIDLSNIDGKALGKQLGTAISDGLSSLASIGKDLASKLGEMFGKVDWVGLGIVIGKQVPALLLGLAAGIINFDLGSLLSGVGDHWFEVLMGVITIAFAPAKFLAPLTKLLSKIPFVGPFIAKALTWVNEIGGKLTKFGGDLLRTFWRGFTGGKFPGGQFVAKVLAAIKGLPGRVADFFKTLQTRIGVWALDAFEAAGRGARKAVGGLLKFVVSIPLMILRGLGSLARLLSPRGVELIEGLLRAVRDRFVTVATFVKGIPGRVIAAVGDLGRTLYNAGVQLMQGLASGISARITDAINAVKSGLSKIKGMLPGSPIKWGPLKNWNNGGAGKRLMDLVAKGITDGGKKPIKAAREAFEKLNDLLKSQRDGLKSTLDGLAGDFAGIADSVKGAFTGGLFDVSATEVVGNLWGGVTTAAKTVGQNFVDNLMGKKAELSGLLSSFTTLQGWGLDPKFLTQLFASGNGALITEMAGMGQAGAVNAATLFGEVNALGDALGGAVATNDPVTTEIKVTNQKLDLVVKALEFLGADVGKEINKAAKTGHRNKKKGGRK